MSDLIERQAAIDAVEILLEQTEEDADVKTWNNAIRGAINSIKHHVPPAQPEQAVKDCHNCKHGNYNDHWKTHFCYNPNECTEWNLWEPITQTERLTDDDFETIRIHLNAYKEKLCNQQRWKEAEEYQNIIDRFMAFASAQPEIIYCKDCKHYKAYEYTGRLACHYVIGGTVVRNLNDFCSRAERITDSNDRD